MPFTALLLMFGGDDDADQGMLRIAKILSMRKMDRILSAEAVRKVVFVDIRGYPVTTDRSGNSTKAIEGGQRARLSRSSSPMSSKVEWSARAQMLRVARRKGASA
jgi:hypothetical protein